MKILDKLKLMAAMSTALDKAEKGVQMKDTTKVVGAVIGLVAMVMQMPTVQHAVYGLLGSHPGVSAIVAGIGAILALVHDPKTM